MAMYAISGIILIFRDTDFLKKEKTTTKQLQPNLNNEALGKEIRNRDLKIISVTGSVKNFKNGSYDTATGNVNFSKKELIPFIDKLTHLHKADTKSPLFVLNIFFGTSLLFFVISSFWMFMPQTSIFKKGIYFALAGVVLFIIMLLV